MNKTYHLSQPEQIPELTALLSQAVSVGEHVIEIRKRVKRRSNLQNKSLHVYCEIISEKMRDAGIDQKELVGKFKAGFTLPATPEMIKEIFRAVGLAMYKKESTADLTTVLAIAVGRRGSSSNKIGGIM